MTAAVPSVAARLNDATRRAFRRHCRPQPRLTGSQWAEQYRELSAEATNRHGAWRNDVVPYLVEIMDACTDRQTQQVTVIAPSQSGKTELVLNLCGFFMHQEPSPILVVQPTVDTAKAFSKDRLAPMIRDTTALKPLVSEAKSRDAENTILSKQYPGGQIDLVGANAPSGLAMRPKRFVLLDERDRHPRSAGTEGDVWKIAYARTRSYQRKRKIVDVTSPTTEEESLAWPRFLRGTQEVYEVPCPLCDHYQTLEFPRLKWTKTAAGAVDPASVHYECAGCGGQIPPTAKPDMLRRGRWVATAEPSVPHCRTFRIHGLVAAFALWDEMAQEFEDCHGDPVLLRAFVNTVLGELWKDRRIENQKDELLARAKPYDPEGRWDVPREAAVLTAGVDVQHDRLEVMVWAWGTGETGWLIERAVLRGDTTQPEAWARLDEFMERRRWRHELGAALPIRAYCVDAGDGALQDVVLRFCRARYAKGARAIKGSSRPDAPLTPKKPTQTKAGRLWVLGVNGITERLMRRLGMPTPASGYLHLNEQADEDLVTQLLSEERKLDPRTRLRRWVVKSGTRNECLDGTKYAYGALLLGPVPVASLALEAERVAAEGAATPATAPEVVPTDPPPPPPRKASRGASWVNRWRR